MKKTTFFLLIFLTTTIIKAQVVLLQENFQDWKPEAGIADKQQDKSSKGTEYSITKPLADGKTQGAFTSNALIVEPEQSIGAAGRADGNGNPTIGRIVLRGAKTYLQLPQLPSVGQVIIKANPGKDQKEFKIQASSNGKKFFDVANTVTPCEKGVIKAYTFKLDFPKPTILRIMPASGSAINIWDIEVYSYSKK